MATTNNETKELSAIADMLRSLLAIELWRGGLSQEDIGKRLGIAKGSVNKMLKGVSRTVGIETAKGQ